MQTVAAYGAIAARAPLAALTIDRREPGPDDIEIDILYCGVCHSDLHTVRNEWGGAKYPVVPGHEIVGRVTRMGSNVKTHAVGDMVGVGVLVDSCRTCPSCAQGLEAYCENGATGTYNDPDTISGGVTYGGYSKRIVADRHFVFPFPPISIPPGSRRCSARGSRPIRRSGIGAWGRVRRSASPGSAGWGIWG